MKIERRTDAVAVRKMARTALLGALFLVVLSSPIHAEWSIETVNSGSAGCFYTSIALDSNGHPNISYLDVANGDLKYAKWTGSEWSIETVDSTGDVGWYTSIALDSNNRPHISYHDRSNDKLKYAKWTGSEWSIETVDSTGNVGWWTSIALDSTNYPHVSYYDWGNDDLKYARWTGSGWSTQTVDDTGSVDWYTGEGGWGITSIALDGSDYPHISYLDNANHNLRYAKWTGSAWSIETVDS